MTDSYPGQALGLPQAGVGSLARWKSRLAALIVDWALSMGIAIVLFGRGVLTESGWKQFAILGVFFVQKFLFTWLASGSVGQLLARIAVVKITGGPIGWWRSFVRTAMICLVIPAVVIGPDRRALDDVALGTVVVNRSGGRTA